MISCQYRGYLFSMKSGRRGRFGSVVVHSPTDRNPCPSIVWEILPIAPHISTYAKLTWTVGEVAVHIIFVSPEALSRSLIVSVQLPYRYSLRYP